MKPPRRCPRCDVTDTNWRRALRRLVWVDGERRKLLEHWQCGEIVAFALDSVATTT